MAQGGRQRQCDGEKEPKESTKKLGSHVDLRWRVRAEGDIGGYVWLPQWIGDKMRIKAVWKRC
jgi:hypothetical protein